jgi:chromosome segregation ATPase
MSIPHDPRLPHPNVVDALFTCLGRGNVLPLADPRVEEAGFGSPVEEEWVSQEKETLAEITRRQLAQLRQHQATIEQQRTELLRRQNELNETCLLRQQDLNRQIKELEARTAAVAEREAVMAEQEKQLTLEQQRVALARRDLQKYRQEMAEQQRELEALKAETLALIEREGESRRQLGEMERVMRERWAARAGSAAALDGM